MTTGGPGVVWFRRDLRLDDNPAWAAATAEHDEVVALFVVEPVLMAAAGEHRRNLLLAHLGALDEELRSMGGRLVIRQGPASDAVPAVLTEIESVMLHLNADAGPFATARDAAVLARVRGVVDVDVHHGNTVQPPGSVLTAKGTLSLVFSAFHKQWSRLGVPDANEPGPGRPVSAASDDLPTAERSAFSAGSDGAWARLQRFLDVVEDYPDARDLPAVAGTSELSADLKFGTISARRVCEVIGEVTPARRAFVRQLAWRDWWAHMLTARPELPDAALREEYDRIRWRTDDEGFDRWCRGVTGFPIVDAGMRQLAETGWMHNRVRMICASFLVKDLLIDWRRGERFFRHHLIDADVSQNVGNWQWVAGTGPDAAPYFRVFNPTTQSAKFDPRGDYIRRWVPELAALDAKTIHEPSAGAPLDLAAAGVVLGDTYPAPIVDHAEARERVLAAYRAARGADGE